MAPGNADRVSGQTPARGEGDRGDDARGEGDRGDVDVRATEVLSMGHGVDVARPGRVRRRRPGVLRLHLGYSGAGAIIRVRDKVTGAEAEWDREQWSGDADFIRQLRVMMRIEHVRSHCHDTFGAMQARMVERFPLLRDRCGAHDHARGNPARPQRRLLTMPKIAISYDDQAVQGRLAELRERGGNLVPAMREIAGHLSDSVNEAVAREASPAGEAWVLLTPATVRDRQRRRYCAGPILERSGDLASRILADWDDSTAVAGTNVVYAATHHFGDPLRGVPARPFLGVSDYAHDAVL